MLEGHGMKKGARVKIEELGGDLLIKNVDTNDERIALQKAAIRVAVGILPTDSKIVEHLLEERRKDRDRENRPFGI
jgi:hypothetical protein